MEFCNVASTLVLVSEKAANIARICRQDFHLLSLLVQEKGSAEKNPRFVQDFKTFADVLVQEVIKAELTFIFPSLSGSIYGEESNEFQCGNEKVIIKVKESSVKTKELISKVLCDNLAAATLAEEIHRNLYVDDIKQIKGAAQLLPKNLGVWIDPIDSTAEYIFGGGREIAPGVYSGLPCVTVIIGIFDTETGDPVAGVINQPFSENINSVWLGKQIYGLSHDGYNSTGPESFPSCSKKLIALSSSEKPEVKEALVKEGYEVLEIPGAGYKLLLVIRGEISAYLLTKPTTFFWDTCGPHAVLKSLGGDILNLQTLTPLKYQEGTSVHDCCNSGGILAYKDEDVKNDLIRIVNNFSTE